MLPNVYSASGGKLIWLLNVLDDNRTSIAIEYYDLQTHNVVQAKTCYQFSVFCLISTDYKMPFFKMLFETFSESIDTIGDSNLRLECYPHTLLDCLLQVNHSERAIQYDLCVIKCVSLKASKQVHNFLKTNRKPYYECVDSLETSYILMMQLFLDANTIQYDHPRASDTKTTVSFRLKFLQSKIPSQFYRNDLDATKTSYFDPTRIFVANGLYIFNTETLRLTLFSTDTAELYKLLPMIAFDLETITDNLTDVPTGCAENERVASYVLVATHMQSAIICVNYLRFSSTDQGEMEEHHSTGSTNWWKERDKLLTEKYRGQFSGNFRELHVWVESYDSEVQLLESFIELYCRGQLLHALVNNSKAKHFFTGHNIIRYDLPFMLRRLKWHQMHQQVEDHVTFDTSSLGGNCSSESILIKFHKFAYVVDSYRVFQQQRLASNLSLKSLTTTYLPNDSAKLDLNPVLIRIYYILGFALRNERDFGFLHDAMTQRLVTVSLPPLPRDVHNCVTNGNFSNELEIYGFDEFLAYNVVNCVSVLSLWQGFNYPVLFSLLTQIYPCNLEKALQANVATRLKIAFDYIALKYRQVLSANFGAFGTGTNRYLFHSRLNESLLYKSMGIFRDNFEGYETHRFGSVGDDDCIEIDDGRYRKNVNQFFAESFTRHPIVDLVKYTSTRKKYPGGAVIVDPGVYSNCVQLDIISQYPNILLGKRLFSDAADICSAGSLQQILTLDSTFRENFSSWLRTDCVQIFFAEENCNGNFASYLRDFSDDPRVVGQLVVDVEMLMKLSPEIPLLLYCPDGRSFLNNFVHHLLNLRKSLQKRICTLQREGKESETLTVLDATQKFVKITVNSIYGLFGNVYTPVAAMVTMLGRKILIFVAKFLPVLTLEILMQHLKIRNWFHSVHGVDLLLDGKFDNELLSSVDGEFNSHLVDSLASADGRGKFRKTCNLLLLHFSIPTFGSISENTCGNETRVTHGIFNETDISLLHLRCLMDGQTSVRILSKTGEKLRQLLTDIGHQNENYIQNIFDALPAVVRNCVFDCDTDGLQFVNTFEMDGKLILDLLNLEVAKVFQLDNIIFTLKQSDHVFSLAKKKYTTFNVSPLCKVKYLEKETLISIDDCTIQHIGYERNALPCFKYVCNFIAVLCLMIHQGRTLRPYKFREIIWSVFNYLDALSPGQLYIRVKLNRLKIDSARRRFIDKYTQTYSGVLRAVYVVKTSTFTKQSCSNNSFLPSSSAKHSEHLVLLDDYLCSVKHQQKISKNERMKLHFGFFLRTFGKIWYQQYCLSVVNVNSSSNNAKEFKKSSTMSIINQYFDDWFSRSPQSRRVDDLDGFLANRFIAINQQSL